MTILFCALVGFGLDLLLGDPSCLTPVHPVVLMGRCISALEKCLRAIFPKTPAGERAAGAMLAAILPTGTLAFSLAVLRLLGWAHPALAVAMQCVWSWQVLAMRDLKVESMRVYRALTTETLEKARQAVSRIVGRDTAALTAEGVTKAAVETIAENFSDGVAAPMFYLLLGGAPLALCYKSINTMDSMVGYKNEKYLHFGRCAAKLDDAANYLPARMAALLLIAAAAVTGKNAAAAWKIWQRDRRNHASPNSAQCEAAMAGALGVQLAGPAYYFGQRYEKPFIGDALRPVEAQDIPRANTLMYTAGFLAFGIFAVLRLIFMMMR